MIPGMMKKEAGPKDPALEVLEDLKAFLEQRMAEKLGPKPEPEQPGAELNEPPSLDEGSPAEEAVESPDEEKKEDEISDDDLAALEGDLKKKKV